jgi:uracil-DNA glycosylase
MTDVSHSGERQNKKQEALSALIKEVAGCRRCCVQGCGIQNSKVLYNFVRFRPEGPRYGGVPSHATDWTRRLNARIMVVGQDWGAAEGELGVIALRRRFEAEASGSKHAAEVWQEMIRPMGTDATRTPMYYDASARLEGAGKVPADFMHHVYYTNAVMCVRRGSLVTGDVNIDLNTSVRNCQPFLIEQIRLLKPAVIVTLGAWPLQSLGLLDTGGLKNTIARVQADTPGFLNTDLGTQAVSVVPLFHHAARFADRSRDQQINDHRFIWRALAYRLRVSGADIVAHAFSSPPE